ncbi:unnamed protein product [Closterium sp. NIES-53]
MASLRVLAFDYEGRPIQFDTWLDDLQLYLLSDSKDSWLTRDAAARLAIRNHLQLAECAHFGQHRTAQALYDAVVARYSSPATAALGRLLLPYLSPELSAFATEEDLVSHLCASDARYRAATPSEFLDKNQPPMFITLYFIITRLSDSLRSVRDHFLSLDPTVLTIDLLEQHLLVAETSVVALGAACGTPRTPFFEGCSPSPLAPSYASVAVVDVLGAEDVGAASASSKHRSSKGKGGRGGGSGSEGGGGGSSGGSVAPPCSCRLLTHHTLLLHHRLSHPSLPRLNGMLSRLLVSCLPKSLPPVPPLPAPPCLPCVEGRQRAAPHSSSSPPTTAPLQTLHMDVWGPACSVSSFASCSAKTFLSCVCTLDRGAPHWLSHGGRLYLRDPCGCSPFSVAGCGPVRCASAASESASPPSVGGEYALSTDVLEDRQEDFDCLTAAAITGPYSSQWQAAMDAEMASWKSTGTYVDAVPQSRANIVDGTWIFRWSLRRPVYGLRQVPREWHDTLRTTLVALGFTPTAGPSLFLRTDMSLPPFYVLVYVDDLVFATADNEALTLVKSELQKKHTCANLGPSALQLLVLLATAHSSAYRSLALSSTFGRVLRRSWGSCLEDGVQLSSLVTQTLLGLMTQLLSGRHRVTPSASVPALFPWRTTCSSLVLSSSCEAEIYVGAMAAEELRWLTYLLNNLGEQPRSRPVLYVDNKAIIAVCREHRLEHRTKHIALRFFLARELQQLS